MPTDVQVIAEAIREGRYDGYARVNGVVYRFRPGQDPEPVPARMEWDASRGRVRRWQGPEWFDEYG